MKPFLLVPILAAVVTGQPKTYPELATETAENLKVAAGDFDHERREVMIPMRDGVKLFTVILVPKGARNAPILLTRTPYNASDLTKHAESAHLASVLQGYDNVTDIIVEGGYIRAMQDVRGKYGSEGDYVMTRPVRGPRNPTPVDHATDTWDTVDWLVKNVPETNRKVGIIGVSYDGFLPLMALFDPHPALKVSVPMNPMVDGWKGDDWFHNGAFRQTMMSYIYDQQGTRKNETKWWSTHYDEYDSFRRYASAGELGKARGLDQMGFWRKIVEHPGYDAWWRDQALDQLLARQPLKVPVMLVHSLWDQEDIYGAPAVYKAIKPKDTDNDKVFLAIGPWYHGQMNGEGSELGIVKFRSDTALHFRREILRPFLDQYLKDGAAKANLPVVSAFETGTNKWRALPGWPPASTARKLYLRADMHAGFDEPRSSEAQFSEYVSDPAKPVPYRQRPIDSSSANWRKWLTDDQREASGRTDVLTFTSPVLTEPLKIAGAPVVNLVASTSGTDSDWVVKLIDLYPDEVAAQPAMGGYQLAIAMDIFRGRYRESLETPKPLAPGVPLGYRFALPNANHVFLPGHRLMVHVQSSWFPLYDRNPQTFTASIFWAKPEDYRKATQRVYHTPGNASFLDLPVVSAK